jgi:hypothetical protein
MANCATADSQTQRKQRGIFAGSAQGRSQSFASSLRIHPFLSARTILFLVGLLAEAVSPIADGRDIVYGGSGITLSLAALNIFSPPSKIVGHCAKHCLWVSTIFS